MTKTWRYLELCKISRLRNNGRVLLGKYIYFTEKRDGSCLAVSLFPASKLRRFLNWMRKKDDMLNWKVRISSRKREFAKKDIWSDLVKCDDASPVWDYLFDHPTHIVFGELLRMGISPTRMEDHKKVEFIVFDIVDLADDEKQFKSFQQVHQECYHYRMKCVQLFGEGRFTSMESLLDYRDEMLKICKETQREGVVLKTFQDGRPLYAKEKLDTATPRGHPKIEKGKPTLPPLPFSEAMGAVDKVYADLGEDFGNKTIAMPVVAQYIKEEMKKHLCSAPEFNFYNLYCQYCADHNIEAIETPKSKPKPKKQSLWQKIRNLLKI